MTVGNAGAVDLKRSATRIMTAKKALVIVVLWGVTFASIGGVIGATLGTVAPDYYRSIFRDGHSPHFNPFQVGLGLGVTQGLAR